MKSPAARRAHPSLSRWVSWSLLAPAVAALVTCFALPSAAFGGSSTLSVPLPKTGHTGPAMTFRTPPAANRPAPSATRAVKATGEPWLGVLQPTSGQVSTLRSACVSKVVLSVGWDVLQPAPGNLRAAVVSELVGRLRSYRAAGFSVVLDLGLQYPPSWVFGLPGQTRFVNQYGDVWRAGLSEDVPNAVFNPAVRAAQAAYLTRLAAAIGPAAVDDIRIGGLLSGELRYPPAVVGRHVLSIWAYDSAAQLLAPVKNWRPGSGTAAQAKQFLAFYFNSLTNYETWLMRSVNGAFPGIDQQVLLPSWGLRPGMVDTAVAAGLRNTTNAEVNGMMSAGLDWASQVKAMASSGARATVYSTWIDAPSQGSSPQQVAPIQYLASLAAQYGLPVAGENTGGGGVSAFDLAMSRTRSLHLAGLMYMSGAALANGRSGMSESGFRQACTRQSWAP